MIQSVVSEDTTFLILEVKVDLVLVQQLLNHLIVTIVGLQGTHRGHTHFHTHTHMLTARGEVSFVH